MAQSDDVYLRKDVFDAKMEAFMAEIRLGNAEIRKDIEKLDQKIDYKIEAVNNRIDAVNLRINDVQTSVYWGFSLLALMFAFFAFTPSIVDFLKNLRKPSVSLEDVERLISQAVKPKA